MFSIKNLSKIIVILMFFIMVPASSYAIVDFSVYGVNWILETKLLIWMDGSTVFMVM